MTFDIKPIISWANYSQAYEENWAKTIRWYVKEECRVFKWGQCAYPEEEFEYYGTTNSGQTQHFSYTNHYPRTIRAVVSDGKTVLEHRYWIGDLDNTNL